MIWTNIFKQKVSSVVYLTEYKNIRNFSELMDVGGSNFLETSWKVHTF